MSRRWHPMAMDRLRSAGVSEESRSEQRSMMTQDERDYGALARRIGVMSQTAVGGAARRWHDGVAAAQ